MILTAETKAKSDYLRDKYLNKQPWTVQDWQLSNQINEELIKAMFASTDMHTRVEDVFDAELLEEFPTTPRKHLQLAVRSASEGVETPKRINPFKKQVRSLEDAAKAELDELESTIETGLDSWIKTTECLQQVKDKGLYKLLGYKSFCTYCKERWNLCYQSVFNDFTSLVVYQNLDGYRNRKLTKNYCKVMHPLKDKELQIEVWQKAQEYPKLTAKLLTQLVNERLGKSPKPKTTKSIQVPIEVAEQISKSAKELKKTEGELVTALFQKLIDS